MDLLGSKGRVKNEEAVSVNPATEELNGEFELYSDDSINQWIKPLPPSGGARTSQIGQNASKMLKRVAYCLLNYEGNLGVDIGK